MHATRHAPYKTALCASPAVPLAGASPPAPPAPAPSARGLRLELENLLKLKRFLEGEAAASAPGAAAALRRELEGLRALEAGLARQAAALVATRDETPGAGLRLFMSKFERGP